MNINLTYHRTNRSLPAVILSGLVGIVHILDIADIVDIDLVAVDMGLVAQSPVGYLQNQVSKQVRDCRGCIAQ